MNGLIDLLFLIPKFVIQLITHESPVINGDGTVSRDFTYIENVIQMNHLALTTENSLALGQVFNTAVGERNNLNQLCIYLKKYLSVYDTKIADIEIIYGPARKGDIAHSLACIDKAKNLLGYKPTHNFNQGLKEAVNWYWNNYKK